MLCMGDSVPFCLEKKYVGMFFMLDFAYVSFDVLKSYLKKEYSLSVFDGLSELELRRLEDFSYTFKSDGNIYAFDGVNEFLFVEFV